MPGDVIVAEADVETPTADEMPEVVEAPAVEAPPTQVILDALKTAQDPRKALLSAMTAGNENAPQIDLLMKLLGGDDDSEDARREELRAEVCAEQEAAVAELSETAKKLFAEREEYRARIELLAAALGACPTCFGENLLCDTCHGAGRPGARAPSAIEFRTYILPAVERVRAAIRRDPYRRPWPRSSMASPGINTPQTVTTSGGLS